MVQPIFTKSAENDSIHIISKSEYDNLGLSAADVSICICEEEYFMIGSNHLFNSSTSLLLPYVMINSLSSRLKYS